MKSTYPITKAQAQFPALCRRKETTPVTRRGEVVAFIVPRPRMQELLEQMEILANPEAMKAIRRARSGKAKDHPLSAPRSHWMINRWKRSTESLPSFLGWNNCSCQADQLRNLLSMAVDFIG